MTERDKLLAIANAAHAVFYGPQKGHIAVRLWADLEKALKDYTPPEDSK